LDSFEVIGLGVNWLFYNCEVMTMFRFCGWFYLQVGMKSRFCDDVLYQMIVYNVQFDYNYVSLVVNLIIIMYNTGETKQYYFNKKTRF